MFTGNLVEFEEKTLTIQENDGMLSVAVKRRGDMSEGLSVRCYTRSRSAKGDADYVERPADSDHSLIEFNPGMFVNDCQHSCTSLQGPSLVARNPNALLLGCILNEGKKSTQNVSSGAARFDKFHNV